MHQVDVELPDQLAQREDPANQGERPVHPQVVDLHLHRAELLGEGGRAAQVRDPQVVAGAGEPPHAAGEVARHPAHLEGVNDREHPASVQGAMIPRLGVPDDGAGQAEGAAAHNLRGGGPVEPHR